MRQNDLRSMRRLLGELVEKLDHSHRELEDLLEIGHGNLHKLLDGKIELRVRHLLTFAELLQVAPSELVAAGCPESEAAATRRLSDWLPSLRAAEPARPPAHTELPVTREELTRLLRQEVRREVARQAARRPPAAPDGEPTPSD